MNPSTMGGAREFATAPKLVTPIVTQSGSHRERDDDYCRVVARLDSRTRVIVCSDRLQWIVQRRDAGTARRGHWRALSLYRQRKALIVAGVRLARTCDPAALALLAALPKHFKRGASHG
jgi:hypothetical protein